MRLTHFFEVSQYMLHIGINVPPALINGFRTKCLRHFYSFFPGVENDSAERGAIPIRIIQRFEFEAFELCFEFLYSDLLFIVLNFFIYGFISNFEFRI